MKPVSIILAILGMIIVSLLMIKICCSPWDGLNMSLLLFVSAFFSKLTKYVLDYMDKQKGLKPPAASKEIPVQKKGLREPRKVRELHSPRKSRSGLSGTPIICQGEAQDKSALHGD
jgi:1,4-dihydroxy-2-naphthoate octaprenyltransferase